MGDNRDKLIYAVIVAIVICLLFLPSANLTQIPVDNEPISKDGYYLHEEFLGSRWNLNVNITANSPVDIFIFSEDAFMDYEVNGVVNPPHTGWYALNTTTYQKNLTVSEKGRYFLVVDNKAIPPNGAMPAGSVNVSGNVKVENNKSSGELRSLGELLFLIILIVSSIYYLFRVKKEEIVDQWIFLMKIVFVSLLCVAIFDLYHFFGGDKTSALYLLSAMLQSLAAILTIFVTVTFIVAQIASQKYTHHVFTNIIRNGTFLAFLVVYIVTMAVLAILLADNKIWTINIPYITHLNPIDFAILLFIIAIMALVS